MPSISSSREICKACYHANSVGFRVPDTVWNAVVPERLRNGVVCLGCFTRLADECGVPWDEEIEFFPVSLITHLRGEQLEAQALAAGPTTASPIRDHGRSGNPCMSR